MKPFSFQSRIGRRVMSWIQGYDHGKYWRRRAAVVDPDSGTWLPVKLWYLYYIKKVDARHGCSFGTNLNAGSRFDSPPLLPHGPAGIFIGHDLHFGTGVTIFQQVTVAHGGGGQIGDGVILGAGSKVLAGRKIGARAKVGANCVVVEDIPAGATVVLPKPRIIMN